jgi:hypothetical protein
MTRNDRIKLIAADTAARLLVYGPLAAAAAVFCPLALIPLALGAAQPWFGEGLGMAATYLTRKFPTVMNPINRLVDKYAGARWWTHAGVLIAAVAVAVVPVPAVAAHLPGFLKSGLDLLGGPNQVWAQYVLPFAVATGLPFATKLATQGFDWAFSKIPGLAAAVAERAQRRAERQAGRDAIRKQMRGVAVPQKEDVSVSQPSGPALAESVGHTMTTPMLAPDALAAPPTRRVVVPVHERVIVERGVVLPEVVRIATPPRIPVPRADVARSIEVEL